MLKVRQNVGGIVDNSMYNRGRMLTNVCSATKTAPGSFFLEYFYRIMLGSSPKCVAHRCVALLAAETKRSLLLQKSPVFQAGSCL